MSAEKVGRYMEAVRSEPRKGERPSWLIFPARVAGGNGNTPDVPLGQVRYCQGRHGFHPLFGTAFAAQPLRDLAAFIETQDGGGDPS